MTDWIIDDEGWNIDPDLVVGYRRVEGYKNFQLQILIDGVAEHRTLHFSSETSREAVVRQIQQAKGLYFPASTKT